MVQVTVIKDASKGYGYNLKHNQQPGFNGIIGNVWAWCRYKKDAIESAGQLMKCWDDISEPIPF